MRNLNSFHEVGSTIIQVYILFIDNYSIDNLEIMCLNCDIQELRSHS